MPAVTAHGAANRSACMKEAMGPWRLVRTLGRDLSGVYYSGRRDDGRRATLYVSSDIAATRGDSFGPLLRLHRDVVHPGLVCFRSVDRISPKGFAEAFEIYELRRDRAEADAGELEFCRAWEAVYAALREGPLAIANVELAAFLAKYPDDSVARYHRSSARQPASPA